MEYHWNEVVFHWYISTEFLHILLEYTGIPLNIPVEFMIIPVDQYFSVEMYQ